MLQFSAVMPGARANRHRRPGTRPQRPGNWPRRPGTRVRRHSTRLQRYRTRSGRPSRPASSAGDRSTCRRSGSCRSQQWSCRGQRPVGRPATVSRPCPPQETLSPPARCPRQLHSRRKSAPATTPVLRSSADACQTHTRRAPGQRPERPAVRAYGRGEPERGSTRERRCGSCSPGRVLRCARSVRTWISTSARCRTS